MIKFPRHGKDVVDTINTCNKRYLIREIYMIDTPEIDNSESRMNGH